MRQIYQLTDKVRDIVDGSEEILNDITVGNVDDFLNKERNFFPAVLIDYGSATINNEAASINMNIIVVDKPLEDSMEDSLNTTFAVACRIVAELQEATVDAEYELARDIQADYLWDDGTQGYVGWGMTLPITFANTSHNG